MGKHHQVMLFFYMVVLFLIFVIQFSCSCAALSVNTKDQQIIIHKGWDTAALHTPNIVKNAEETFDCCGSGLEYVNGTLTPYTNPTADDVKWSELHKVNFKEDCVNHTAIACKTCYKRIEGKVDAGFSTAGGLGLFFSFPEILGVICTHKYRLLIRDMGEFA